MAMDKSPDAFRTISEVATDLDLPQHVLRFWETRFSQIKPMKRTGGRRYYRPDDVELVRAIKGLLYGQGYTIKGVQRLLKENGVRAVAAAARAAPAGPRQPALAQGGAAADAPLALDAQLPDLPLLQLPLDEVAAAPGDSTSPPAPGGGAREPLARLAAELAECARLLRAARV